jgi:hypothetical protein
VTRQNLMTQSLRFLLWGEGETGMLVYTILLKYRNRHPKTMCDRYISHERVSNVVVVAFDFAMEGSNINLHCHFTVRVGQQSATARLSSGSGITRAPEITIGELNCATL